MRVVWPKTFEILTDDKVNRVKVYHPIKFRSKRSNIAEIQRFNGFQNGGRPPSWTLKKIIFLTEPIGIIVPNFVRSVQPLLRYGDFSIFQNGGLPPSWIFPNVEILSANRVQRVNMFYQLPCQILCRSVKPLPRYGYFSTFQDGDRRPSSILISEHSKL